MSKEYIEREASMQAVINTKCRIAVDKGKVLSAEDLCALPEACLKK